jgi:chemotaxis protein histidine kinase CheA/CheY-like chemotaxis protein
MPQYSSDIDAAEAELQQELREMFTVDTGQHLETYFSLIQQLNGRSWTADIQHLYRAIHTVKGGAVTVAADAMLHAAVALEDLLSDLRYLEQAPTLADRQLEGILLEAGELLSSSIEITETGDAAIARVQPTVTRLQQLHALVKQLYLPDWNELRQVHQEFAEQGFELVTLELEMALGGIPAQGVVPAKAIETAGATIEQLTQIGVDLELADGWTRVIQFCQQLVDRHDCQLWRQVWPEYFQVLKTCVKNSGEISDTEIDRLVLPATVASSGEPVTASPDSVVDELVPPSVEQSQAFNLDDDLDSFFFNEDEEIISNISVPVTESTLVTDRLTVGAEAQDLHLAGDLDNLFFDNEDDELAISSTAPIAPNLELKDELGNDLDNLFFDNEVIKTTTLVANSIEINQVLAPDLTTTEPVATDLGLGDVLDNFFADEDEETIAPLSIIEDEVVENSIDLSDWDEDADLPIDNIAISALADFTATRLPITSGRSNTNGYDEAQLSVNNDRDLELFQGIFDAGGDSFTDLDELDESELIALIESGFTLEIEAPEAAADATIIFAAEMAPADLPASPAVTAPVRPVEAPKRGIQIPVPLERLDKSAQQVVDTLLTARAVMNVSDTLQSQLSQLTNLTQESAQFVTKLRQLQDDYALLRNLSDEQDSGNNVTLERYRQGYTTINRLLENMLRMSELGQEIETATYQSATRLDALDRSILRLKDGIETSRLVPFRNMTLRAKAILRDLTNRYGKPAELIALNEQIELDAGIVQQLEPALLHLLRNAYDHGLEPAQDRLKAGKPAQGMILVSLNRRGNLYRLTIEDDGGGIDADSIHQLAQQKGFTLNQTRTATELLAVLCQPGFSSSSNVSEVSGRGVGMDVVAAQIASINGKLSLETTIGHGSKFTIEVPAPQLLVPCVLLQVGDRTIAFPTDEILETALMSSMTTEPVEVGTSMCTWKLTTSQGEVDGFDLASYWQPGQRSLPDTAICLRTRQADGTAEIWSIADELLGQAELLINPLPSPLITPVGLLGVSLQPDGRLISILDPIALTSKLATITNDSSDYNLNTLAIEHAKSTAPTILIVDDAALMRRRFEASLNTHGFITYTCNDGVEALNWLQSNRRPDLMITDVEMPNMDGFTLIDRCRQAQLDMPILVVSSRLSEEWGKEARRLGASDYLNKGFSTTELLLKVDALLSLVPSK